MGGSLLAAASAGDCRNVKGPCPALRPGRLRGAFRFRELVPCFGPRPAAFNSLRSCSFSPRRRSISLPACTNCSRKPRFSASYSFSCLRRSSCLEPSIAPYRDTKPPKCPAFSANQLPKIAIVLVTPAYLASEYIKDKELPEILKAATEGRLRIIPVMVEHTFVERTDLWNYQFANPPS